MKSSVDHRRASDCVGRIGADTSSGTRQAPLVRCQSSGAGTMPPDKPAAQIRPWRGVQGRGRTDGGESGVAFDPSLKIIYDLVGSTTREVGGIPRMQRWLHVTDPGDGPGERSSSVFERWCGVLTFRDSEAGKVVDRSLVAAMIAVLIEIQASREVDTYPSGEGGLSWSTRSSSR